MGQSFRLDQILEGRAPEFLGDDDRLGFIPPMVDPGTGTPDPAVGPGAAPITNAAQLREAINAAGGTLYVWALPPAYPGPVQIALQAGGFKVQPDLSDPGSYKITFAAGLPAPSFSLAGLGLDSNTIILGAVALAGIAIISKVLK